MNGDPPTDQRPKVIDAKAWSATTGNAFASSRSRGCGCSSCLGCLGAITALVLLISFLEVVIATVYFALPGFVTGAVCVLLLLGIYRLFKWLFS